MSEEKKAPETDPRYVDEFYVENKDPNYIYRWCNDRDRNMRLRLRQGYKPVEGVDDLPAEFRQNPQLAGMQSTGNPGGGNLIRRGDLILCRITRELHERNVAAPRRREMERHRGVVEDAVASANDNAQRALRNAGYRSDQIRQAMVFADEAEPFKNQEG